MTDVRPYAKMARRITDTIENLDPRKKRRNQYVTAEELHQFYVAKSAIPEIRDVIKGALHAKSEGEGARLAKLGFTLSAAPNNPDNPMVRSGIDDIRKSIEKVEEYGPKHFQRLKLTKPDGSKYPDDQALDIITSKSTDGKTCPYCESDMENSAALKQHIAEDHLSNEETYKDLRDSVSRGIGRYNRGHAIGSAIANLDPVGAATHALTPSEAYGPARSGKPTAVRGVGPRLEEGTLKSFTKEGDDYERYDRPRYDSGDRGALSERMRLLESINARVNEFFSEEREVSGYKHGQQNYSPKLDTYKDISTGSTVQLGMQGVEESKVNVLPSYQRKNKPIGEQDQEDREQ